MAVNSTTLIEEITRAFKGVELEDGIGLSEGNAIDDYRDATFRAACRQKDEKKSWVSISPADLNQYNYALHYFDPKGMRFHLPAFMIIELKGEFYSGIAFVLTHFSDHTKSQFTLLNIEQRKAVRQFLEYLLENGNYEFGKETIELAIRDYWAL
jgi:hypothetical protein